MKSIREALLPLEIAFLINMPHSNLTNINQISLTNFRRAQSELWSPNLPWSNLSGEPLRTCFKYWKVRSAPHRCDFKCNLFQFPNLNTALEKDPHKAVCNYPTMLLTQLKWAQGPAALPRQSSAWLAGSNVPSMVTKADQTLAGAQAHHIGLCLTALVCLTAAGASHSSLPENSAPHTCRANFLRCPRTHTPPVSQPYWQTEGSRWGPLLEVLNSTNTGMYMRGKKQRRVKKCTETCKTDHVWLKTCRKSSLTPQVQEARAVVLMKGHSPQQLHWSCTAQSRELSLLSWTSPFSCWFTWLHNTYGTRQIWEIPEAMLEYRGQPSQGSSTSTVLSRYQPKVQRPPHILASVTENSAKLSSSMWKKHPHGYSGMSFNIRGEVTGEIYEKSGL